MIIDNFLGEHYPELRSYADTAIFCDEVNPVDGVIYPDICKDIPANTVSVIMGKLSDIMGYDVLINTIFIRRSPFGVKATHQAHTDRSMGAFSMMLYMSDNDNAGTSILYHKPTGIAYNPEIPALVDQVAADQNNYNKWVVTDFVSMKQDRVFIFRADSFHRAEPVGGFGNGNDSRTVLTCFYD